MEAVPVSAPEWLAATDLLRLSREMNDPERVRQARQTGWERFRQLPLELNPLYRKYAYFTGMDLRGADPLVSGPPVPVPPVRPGEIQIVHDASGTRVRIADDLADLNIELRDLRGISQVSEAEQRAFLESGDPFSDKFQSLNVALVNRAVFLRIPDSLGRPVRVQDLSILSRPNEVLAVRRYVNPGRGNRLLYSEEVYSSSRSAEQRLYSSSVHIEPADASDTVYFTVHAPDGQAVGFYSRHARTGRDSKLGWIFAGYDGFRTNLRNISVLALPGGEIEDLQTTYGDAEQASNSYVEITHAADDTRGQSISRGVYKDRSRGTSRGLMRIQPQTRKVVSYLSEHAMLLSKGARSESVPGLEILSAMDVKATHSSSVAPIDPEKVFYLQSRGIEPDHATRLISEGFLSHVLDRAPVEGLRDILHPLLDARWERRSIGWSGEGAWRGLPPLSISAWGAMGDWRMDTKLRDTAGRA